MINNAINRNNYNVKVKHRFRRRSSVDELTPRSIKEGHMGCKMVDHVARWSMERMHGCANLWTQTRSKNDKGRKSCKTRSHVGATPLHMLAFFMLLKHKN